MTTARTLAIIGAALWLVGGALLCLGGFLK